MQFLKNLSLTEAHNILKRPWRGQSYPSIGTAVYAWDGDDFTSLIYRGILKEVRTTKKLVGGEVITTVKFAVVDELEDDSYVMAFDHIVELGKSNEGRKVINEDFIGHILGKCNNGLLVVENCDGNTIYVKPEDVIDFDWEKIKRACTEAND